MNRNAGKIISLFALGVLFIGFTIAKHGGDNGVKFLGKTDDASLQRGEDVRALPLCDGESKILVSVDGLPPGEMMPEETAREAAALMLDKYREMREENGEILLAHGKDHSKREMMIWKTELDRIIDTGYKLFHSPELGTNGVSCDMCHPDGSNTHPESYPKFQIQLKEVVLLRDMINWCIENPLEGPVLDHDDPRMKALEAYILSTRKGKTLEPGKH
jgi:hypothetical protein